MANLYLFGNRWLRLAFLFPVILCFSTAAKAQTPNLLEQYNQWIKSQGLDTLFRAENITEPRPGYQLLQLSLICTDAKAADVYWDKLSLDYRSTSGSRLAEALFFEWLLVSEHAEQQTAVTVYRLDGSLLAALRLDDNNALKVSHSRSMASTSASLEWVDLHGIKLQSNLQKTDREILNSLHGWAKEYYSQKGGTFSSGYTPGDERLEFSVCNLRAVVLPPNNNYICGLLNRLFDNICNLNAYEQLHYNLSIEHTADGFKLHITALGRYAPAFGEACIWERARPMENSIWSSLLDSHLASFKQQAIAHLTH